MDRTKEIINTINFYIKLSKNYFDNGNIESYKHQMTHIHGMVEALTILTEKNYIITETGLKER